MASYLRGRHAFTLSRFELRRNLQSDTPTYEEERVTLLSYCNATKAVRDVWLTFTSARLLEESAIFQVFFDDDVSHGIKHKLDVLRVCGAGHVGVDLFDVSAHVQVQELHLDVVTGILVSVRAFTENSNGAMFLWNCGLLKTKNVPKLGCSLFDKITVVLWEAHAQVSLLDLLQEHVLLVEEEYDGGGCEVAVVADAVEQVQAFVHTILWRIKFLV